MSSAKAKQSNGAGKKAAKPPASSNGTATPVSTTNATAAVSFEPVVYGTGRPDKSLYDAEQNKIRAEIDAAQAKLVCCLSHYTTPTFCVGSSSFK